MISEEDRLVIDLRTQLFRTFAYETHANSGQLYDTNLPYSFHLEAARREAYNWAHLLDLPMYTLSSIISAVDGHDLLEDTRLSYNDILNVSNETTAEIIRAVTNYSRGRNRAERMPDWIYEEIRNTPNADFVKLCDRLANVKYSIFTESRMTKMYAKEHDDFIKKVTNRPEVLSPMIEKLSSLFR